MPDDATFTATVVQQQILWSGTTYVSIRTWSHCKYSIVRMASVLISVAHEIGDLESTRTDYVENSSFLQLFDFVLKSLHGQIAFLESRVRLNRISLNEFKLKVSQFEESTSMCVCDTRQSRHKEHTYIINLL